MKKTWYAVCCVTLASALFAFTACGGGDAGPAVVTLTHTDGTMYSGDAFDYTSLFTLKYDGTETEVKAEDIDASAVNPYHEGEYAVTFSRTVNGKVYEDSATLTVRKSDVQIEAASSRFYVKLGEAATYDYTSMFSVTRNGEQVDDLTADMITVLDADRQEVESFALGEYIVDLTYTFPAAAQKNLESDSWSGRAFMYVNPDETPDIASAFSRAYDNFTLTRTVASSDGEVSYTNTYKSAAKKYLASGALDMSYHGDVTYAYRIKSDGSVGRAWVKDDSEPSGWRDPYSDISEIVFRPDFSDYTGEEFALLGGVYVMEDPEELRYAGPFFFGDAGSELGALTKLHLSVENGAIAEIVGTFEESFGEMDEITVVTDVYSDIGTTDFAIPSTEPEVKIVTSNKECFVGDDSFDDWASMFSVTVDGKAHALTAEEAAKIDHSAVDFQTAAEYDVVLHFTAEDGETEHTATAKYTVKALPTGEVTFAEALAAAAANCTVTKKTFSGFSSETNAGDNMIIGAFTYDTKNNYLYKIIPSGTGETIQRYSPTDGVLGDPETGTYRFARLDVYAKNAESFTDSDGDGIYECTDAAVLSEIMSACVGFGTASKAQIEFKNGVIVSVKILYKLSASAAKDSYHLYEISAVGTTELPFELPV